MHQAAQLSARLILSLPIMSEPRRLASMFRREVQNGAIALEKQEPIKLEKGRTNRRAQGLPNREGKMRGNEGAYELEAGQ